MRAPLAPYQEPKIPNHVDERNQTKEHILTCAVVRMKKKQEIIKSNPSPFLLQASSISFYIYIAYNNNKKEW